MFLRDSRESLPVVGPQPGLIALLRQALAGGELDYTELPLRRAVLNLLCFWFFKIPMAYVLSVRLELGPRGVFMAITCAYSLLALLALALFRRGTWKTQKL